MIVPDNGKNMKRKPCVWEKAVRSLIQIIIDLSWGKYHKITKNDCLQPPFILNILKRGTVVVMVVWQLDLQLPMQSVPITTKVVSSNHVHGEVYSIQHYVLNLSVTLRHVGDFLRILRFPPLIKTDRHDITEILLKVALNTINQPTYRLKIPRG